MESPRPEPILLDEGDPRIVRTGNRKERRKLASLQRRVRNNARSLRTAIPGFVK